MYGVYGRDGGTLLPIQSSEFPVGIDLLLLDARWENASQIKVADDT